VWGLGIRRGPLHNSAYAGKVAGVNLEKVVFGFFVLMAATLNFGYVVGDLTDPNQHNIYELYAAVIVNVIATILKFGDRTQIGAIHLATSLVASIQLIIAATFYVYASQVGSGVDVHELASVVSLAIGACLANIVSLVLLVAETLTHRRH
jgi:hypothetical protein